MKCDKCHRDANESINTAWMNWVKVLHFVDFLRAEDIIEPGTASEINEAMMSIKYIVLQEDERISKMAEMEEE